MTTLPIVGARFQPPAEEVLKLLPSGTKLLLRRQPDNPYDENAMQVLLPLENHGYSPEVEIAMREGGIQPDQLSLHLGFIPREAAKELAPRMDTRKQIKTVIVHEGRLVETELEISDLAALLTFGLTGLPSVSFEEPKE